MFEKRRVGNLFNPCLNSETCHLIGIFTDLNEHEQEMMSGSGGRDDMWAMGSKKQKTLLASNFKLDVGDLSL
ncbi:MAG: hypothetical protein HC903_05325 [Methylacidiphilales bacterium]|nr:hypothetical protein [Candidatus Methylacidiphilales bacterium]NJR14833.1 hypothetical protein [Calothrix sp. CSU_2_0]